MNGSNELLKLRQNQKEKKCPVYANALYEWVKSEKEKKCPICANALYEWVQVLNCWKSKGSLWMGQALKLRQSQKEKKQMIIRLWKNEKQHTLRVNLRLWVPWFQTALWNQKHNFFCRGLQQSVSCFFWCFYIASPATFKCQVFENLNWWKNHLNAEKNASESAHYSFGKKRKSSVLMFLTACLRSKY